MIAFIRKEEKFRLNRYVQYVPTEKSVGVYCVLGRDEMVRLVSAADYAWEDGDERPRGDYHKVPFQWVEFRTYRRDFPWNLGYKAIDQSKGSWEPKLVHMNSAISKAMTTRTSDVITALETTANWGANTADANTLNLGAGKWTTASDQPLDPHYNAIFKTLTESAKRIHLATNGEVGPLDLRTIVSPDLAIAMSTTAELNNYCRESPYAREILEKGLDPQYQLWGLPQRYKGFEFVVEDSPKVAERNTTDSSGNLVEATTNRIYIKSATSAIIVARPGSLDGESGPNFSTVQIYHYGGLLEVEQFDNPISRRVEGHVSEDLCVKLASSVSGFLVTNAA